MASIIRSLTHPLVKHLVKLRDDKSYRTASGTVLIQGRKVVAEVGQQTPIKLLLVADETAIPEGLNCPVVLATDSILKKVSGVVASDGVIAEVALPHQALLDGARRVMALDAVTDPGNLGTLVRTALALGWDGAYLINCCDPYNDKALRAAMGATFRLPLRIGTVSDLRRLAANQGWRCLAADLKGQSPTAFQGQAPLLLILGSEAHGVSEACRQFSQAVTIPMPGAMESLNVAVAGGILMALLK